IPTWWVATSVAEFKTFVSCLQGRPSTFTRHRFEVCIFVRLLRRPVEEFTGCAATTPRIERYARSCGDNGETERREGAKGRSSWLLHRVVTQSLLFRARLQRLLVSSSPRRPFALLSSPRPHLPCPRLSHNALPRAGFCCCESFGRNEGLVRL